MKKIFILCFAIVVMVLKSNAQWGTYYNSGDELKETIEHYSNYYIDYKGNSFICWSNDDRIKIHTNGVFNCDMYNRLYVTIGFYKDDILIEKVNASFWVNRPKGHYNMAYSYIGDSKKIGCKIIHHLKYVGDVRIIAPKYSDVDFDITIPMNPNIITHIPNYNVLSNNTPHQLVEKFYNIKKQIKSNKKLAKQLVKNSTEYNQMLSNIEKLKAEQKEIEQKYYEITNYSIYQHDQYLQNH